MNRPTIYVSGKFTHPERERVRENIILALHYAKQLWKMGFAVFCPHSNAPWLADEIYTPYGEILGFDLWILTEFDCIFMLPNWRDSPGAQKELYLAKMMKIPVFFNFKQARAWLRGRDEEKEE